MKKLLIIPFLLIALNAHSADLKLNSLPSATSIQTTDVFPVVVDPSTNATTKKSTIGNILKNANVTIAGTANEITSSDGQQSLEAPRTWTLSLPSAIDLGDKTLTLPNGTALVTADCDEASEAGRVFVDTDATTGRQNYICEGVNGWVSGGGVGTLTAAKWCVANALGTAIDCTEDNPGGGVGIVTAVGDCVGGDCYDGTSDGGSWVKFYDSDGVGQIIADDITAARVWTLPDATGTIALTTSTVAEATTATALSANGANCSAGYAALGVDSSGAVEGCYQILTQGNIDTSAELRGILTDETGTGSLVFSTAPTFGGTVTATAFAGDGSALTGLATSFTDSDGLAALMDDETGTLLSVFSDSPIFSTIVTLPSAAAPTIDALGELSLDTDIWASGRGTPVFFDGTAAVATVAALVSDAPTDGQVPKYNTGGTITWEADDDTAGITVTDTQVLYASGADTPAGDSGFTYNETTNIVTADGFIATATATPELAFHDSDAGDGDDNVTLMANCSDCGSGSEDVDLTIYQQVAGTLTDVMYFDADVGISFPAGLVNLPDDTIYRDDMASIDVASDEECLTYESSTGEFEWQACGGGLFTDAGAITHLTSETDDLALGGTTSASPFFFDVGEESLKIGTASSGTIDFGVNSLTDTTVGNLKKGSIDLPVQSAKITGDFITLGASIDGGEGIFYLRFDDSTTEEAVWAFRMPNDYNDNLVAKIGYSADNDTSDSWDVEVKIAAVSYGDSTAIMTVDNFDTLNEVTGGTTTPAVAEYPQEISLTLTNDDSVVAGDLVIVHIQRDHDDADDTLSNDIKVFAFQLEYDRD